MTANQVIAGMVRKAGGFTFQELNLTVDDIAAMSNGGADLSYDFITRPACQVALATGDAEFLRLMLHIMHEQGIDPASLVHALQNHDELTLELVHFWTLHNADHFTLGGQTLSGGELRDQIRATMYDRLTGDNAPYNLRFVTNGVACTMASVAAAALGIRDLDTIGAAEIAAIRDAHLLLVLYNAFQPGVFALSGWDLVGALPLAPAAVADLMADGDTRWINRGAYDLLGVAPEATGSHAGLPRAQALYGALPDQLRDPDSFASRLRHLLDLRRRYRIYESRQLAVPDLAAARAAHAAGFADRVGGEVVVQLNFGADAVDEVVRLEGVAPGMLRELLAGEMMGAFDASGELRIELRPRQGKAYLIQ